MRGWGAALATVALLGAAACTTQPEEPPPLELVVGGDPQPDAVPLARVALTDEQLDQIEEACDGAGGIPVSDADECARVTSLPLTGGGPACSDGDVCLTVWNTRRTEVGSPALLQIVDDRPDPACAEPPCVTQLGLQGRPARDVLEVARVSDLVLPTPSPSETGTTGPTDPSDSASPSDTTSPTGPETSGSPDASTPPATGTPSGTATDGTGGGPGPLTDPGGGVLGDTDILVEPPATTP